MSAECQLERNRFHAARALAKLLGLRVITFPGIFMQDVGRPADEYPFVAFVPRVRTNRLYLFLEPGQFAYCWTPFDENDNLACLVWAYRRMGIASIRTDQTAEQNAAYLVKVCTTPALLSALDLHKRFTAEGIGERTTETTA